MARSNYLYRPKEIAAAGRLVKTGRQISCARAIFRLVPGPENPTPALHHMVIGGDDPCAPGIPGMEVSLDFIGIAYHGLASSHIDALCHVFHDGKMYNGFPATEVRSTGARHNSIMAAKDGIVGRCVLLDIPKLRGEPFVAIDRPVKAAELDAAEKAQQIQVGEGDILLISVGRDEQKKHQPHKPGEEYALAGLDPDCIPWLHTHGQRYRGTRLRRGARSLAARQHDRRLAHSGAHVCARRHGPASARQSLSRRFWRRLGARAENRWEFLLAVAPLRIARGTGSPVNPIAIL